MLALALLATAALAVAQSPSSPSPTPAPTVSRILTAVPVTTSAVVRGTTVVLTSLVPTTLLSTLVPSTLAPNATASSALNATATSAPAPSPTEPAAPVLETHIDAAFGVLGALLVLTGLPSAFLGHKNRWSSFFLTGFYSLALACLALILKYGVLVAVHPPNKTLRGLFVLACGVAGVAGGGISIFFWQQSKYFIGAWGGFAIGLWVQCFRDAGLIRPIGLRYILYITCGVIGFVLCTVPKFHYHILIVGTAITGASAFILGVDCFTTAGLKEFYVYNLGFAALFPKFAHTGFPLSQVMQVELGLVAAVALMGAAVQLRVLVVLRRKLAEINAEERRREAAAEAKAVMRFAHVQHDLAEWEKEHDSARPASDAPLIRDADEPSTATLVTAPRPRSRDGASELGAEPPAARPVSRFSQAPGLLPAMNLGLGLDAALPRALAPPADPELLRKEELLAEIQTIRRSIDALRSEGSAADADEAAPRRARARSLDALAAAAGPRARDDGADDEWAAYVRERRLFQPPAGASAPLAPAPAPGAVADALAARQRLESAFGARRGSVYERRGSAYERRGSALELDARRGSAYELDARRGSTYELDARRGSALDLGEDAGHRRSASGGAVAILPPRRAGAPKEESGGARRTRTFEELVERHTEKLRALQGPVSAREREAAEVAAAKRRWERSRAAEREGAGRRRAEREAALARKGRARSLSADRLGAVGAGAGEAAGSRRVSTAKVQEWQRYQAEVDAGAGAGAGAAGAPRGRRT